MAEFIIAEKFKLEIRWKKVSYSKEGVAAFDSCILTGPVIKDVAVMNASDSMQLDFGNQYLVLVPFYYVATFSWASVVQSTDKIYLDGAVLVNTNINSVPKLRNSDYIVVDTRLHVDETHQFHLTYPAYLLNSNNELYVFGR